MAPRTPLVDPREFFDAQDSPIGSGLGVLFLYYVVDLLVVVTTVWLLYGQIRDPPAGLARGLFSELFWIAIVAIVVYVVAWLVIGGVMHVLSGGSSTDGTFSDALGVAGWAYGPEIVTAPLVLGLVYRKISQVDFDGTDPSQFAADVQAATAEMESQLLPFLLFLGVTAWSVYILAVGVSETHDVPFERTIVAAAVVGLGSIVLMLSQ